MSVATASPQTSAPAGSVPADDGEPGRLNAGLDRGGDLLNPILMKEVRQSFKSKQFLGSFWALLGICWLIGSCGLLFAGEAVEFGAVGGAFFTLFYSVLAFAVLLLVPYGAYRSVLNERLEKTWEVLSITALSPRQIVLGKIACAAMQMLVYYSAVAPFIAFCALLQGFDPRTAAFFLVATAWGAIVASSFAVMLAAVVRQKVWQGLLAGALGSALFGGVWVYIGSAFSGALLQPLPFSEPAFQWSVVALAVVSGSYVVLFVNAASAGLTFEADNRSTAVRVTVTVQFWLMVAGAIAVYFTRPDLLQAVPLGTAVALALTHWLFWGVVFAAEPDRLSRRVRRQTPRVRALRLLATPWLPGGSRGVLLVWLHLAVLAGLAGWIRVARAPALAARIGRPGAEVNALSDLPSALLARDPWTQIVFCGLCYVLIYVGLCGAVMRLGSALLRDFPPTAARLIVLILGPMGLIPPVAARMMKFVGNDEATALDALTPMLLIPELLGRGAGPGHIALLGGLAAAAVAVNLPFVFRQLMDLLGPRTPATAEATAGASAIGGPVA
ncbi:ABC transporter permease [Alienimonas chondri]|uniref:ABC transporter permease n=1 Tax=Alienimonas chondri TaxID=2681879 RepID=A0ABX1V8Y1_9PLAN|nr:hypothetical protein [Alienimonas chondri]NNJ24579.1 hypothetical protein [Alienimonas chondri]